MLQYPGTKPSLFPTIKESLSRLLLSPEAVEKTLAGLDADTAAAYLCQCVILEQEQRRLRERRLLATVAITDTLLLGMFRESPLLLLGTLMLSLVLILASRGFGPLRHNALLGLTTVVLDVHARETLAPLCQVAASLDGSQRIWEAELEAAVRATIARLSLRLSAEEATLLPESVRGVLLDALRDRRHEGLTVAALLTLGSARDPAALPQAELLRASLSESVREAALEYLQELSRRA